MSLLASCGATKPALVRTETVEVKVPVYVALDEKLLVVAPEPATPPLNCLDSKNRKTVCHKDEANYIDAIRAWGRALAGQVDAIKDLQP